jgi:glycerol-3-phosphate acyltransferase PlsY
MFLLKTLHVLAVGLWFGMAVFFSFPVALSLFGTFERMTDASERPNWFPASNLYEKDPANWTPPPAGVDKPPFLTLRDVDKEQGSRAAGAAVSPMFHLYFGIQLGCAAVTLFTALFFFLAEQRARIHLVRLVVFLLANLLVGAGLGMERRVSELRGPRNDATDALLQAAPNIAEGIYQKAVEARREFGMWHGISTMLNLGTIMLVTVAMALAVQLPQATSSRDALAEREPALR